MNIAIMFAYTALAQVKLCSAVVLLIAQFRANKKK